MSHEQDRKAAGKGGRPWQGGRRLLGCAAILCWILLWHFLAAAVDNKILLASPAETVKALWELAGRGSFYLAVGRSLLRIGAGFLAGLCAALPLAACSGRFPLAEQALSPAVGLMKSVPMASFAVLLLIWRGSSFLAAAVCFLVVMPHVYVNILEGLKCMDRRLAEMARVFRMPFRNRFFYICRPALKPYLCGSLKVCVGMCWKAGVAAEVIGVPDYSIGERMYLSKLYLDTSGIFAWTAVVVALGALSEKLVLRLADAFFAWTPACVAAPPRRGPLRGEALSLSDVTKAYGKKAVLDRVSAVYEPGGIYYLTTPSGSGKTTRLHVLAGLLGPDGGTVRTPGPCSMVFQEDRLCEDYSAVKNVEMVTGSPREAAGALGKLLEEDALYKPCRLLSGGMRRRVALVRAMEADSEYVLLDEPFAGMDAITRRRAEEYIRERQRGRILVIATHQKGEKSLGAD